MFSIFLSYMVELRSVLSVFVMPTNNVVISGVLSYLKETFTHTPSYDMSPAMLNVLVKMMLAQAQECAFEQISLPGIRNEFFTLVKMTQEVAKVK